MFFLVSASDKKKFFITETLFGRDFIKLSDKKRKDFALDIDTMDSEDLQNVLSSLSYFDDNSEWGTPLTLGIKDKKVAKDLGGYTNETTTIDNIFKELGLK